MLFPLEEDVIDDPEEPVEVVGELFRCLATIATALKNKGESVNIPGTHEYGSKRTGGLWIWISKKIQ